MIETILFMHIAGAGLTLVSVITSGLIILYNKAGYFKKCAIYNAIMLMFQLITGIVLVLSSTSQIPWTNVCVSFGAYL